MAKYKKYEEEHEQISERLVKIWKEYSDFTKVREDIECHPEKYEEKISELRKFIAESLILARKISIRKADQGGFDTKQRASELIRYCKSLSRLISRYYHPYEVAKSADTRKNDKREGIINTLGPNARSDMEYLYSTLDNLNSMKRSCTEICNRASKPSDDKWLVDAQVMRGELDFIIKRCKFIYKSYKDNEDVAQMVHRKIIYECRVMDARLRRWTDPYTDFA